MRASKGVKGQSSKVNRSKPDEVHISGAEGLYEFSEIDNITRDYFLRAMNHPRGRPDKVVITFEEVKQRPIKVPLLPIATVRCGSPSEAREIICKLLSNAAVSRKAALAGIRIVTSKTVMHGAALMSGKSAIRMEPDTKRGVRASRLGVEKDSEKRLHGRLAGMGINNTTVKDAIILASKVAACRDIVAELCISDDPDYTTGYVASNMLGYVRIPAIKKKGSPSGGRVFFVREGADLKRVIEYLEKKQVMISSPLHKDIPIPS